MNEPPQPEKKEPPVTNDTLVKEEMSMEQLLAEAEAEAALRTSSGALAQATVVAVQDEGVLVDVGLKVEGYIPLAEFRVRLEPPVVGETFPVVMKRRAGPEGHPLVSWKEAREKANWGVVRAAFTEHKPVTGTVVRVVKGGVIVDIGLEAFMPASQIDRRPGAALDSWVGKKVEALVLEMDAGHGGVVLSRRKWLEEEALRQQEIALKSLEVGQVKKGKVTHLTSFGAFVDIGGVEGLLRSTDVAWGRVGKLSEHVKPGQSLEVKILKIDPTTRKISLGRKQLLPHPWDGLQERLIPGRVVKGRVTSLAEFGAFVEVEPAVEGLIHQSELSWHERWAKPAEKLKVGEEVEVSVLSLDRASEKLSLSLKRAQTNPWLEAARLFKPGARVTGHVTNLATFGAFIKLPNGVEGLLRFDDYSWTKKVTSFKGLLTPGQPLEVAVLEVNPQQERLSLGFKQLTADPFAKYLPGASVEGKVTALQDDGAVVELETDILGFVPLSEIADKKLEKPSEALTEGQTIQALVMKPDPRHRGQRITLSIRRYDRREEKQLLKQYRGDHTKLTLADMTEWGAQPPPE